MSGVLCQLKDEHSRAKVHNHGTGSPSGGLCLQELLALSTQIPNHLPYGS